MDERYVATHYFNRILRGWGHQVDTTMDAIVCTRCGQILVPERGKPDVTIPLVYVEYKAHYLKDTSFSLSNISDEQRKWLTNSANHGVLSYLGLGVIDNRKKPNSLVDLYLVDWPHWLEAEALVTPVQDSIPYKDPFRKALRPDKCIVSLFERYRLIRDGKGWKLPPGHTLGETHD